MYRSYRTILILLVIALPAAVSCDRSGGERAERSGGVADTSDSAVTTTASASEPIAGDTVDTWEKQMSGKYHDFGVDSAVYASRDNAITRAVRRASPAIVSITVEGSPRPADDFFTPFFFSRPQSTTGSGFIISEDGMVVTNQHVAHDGAREIMVSLPDGSQYEAEIIGSDELSDLALLRIRADRSFPYIEFGDSDRVMVGEWAIAMGNPFGLFKSAQPSVTVGVVSALNRDFRPSAQDPRVYMDMIQTDAAINRGNSGGPLINSAGEVIGVNTLIISSTGGSMGLGFAIPSNQVISTIDQLLTQGEVETAFDPGFEMTRMTMELAVKHNLPAMPGLLVTSVNRDGPAFESGVLPGDVIVRIGSERVYNVRHVQALYRQYAEGDTMQVELFRRNQLYEAQMVLRKKVTESSGN